MEVAHLKIVQNSAFDQRGGCCLEFSLFSQKGNSECSHKKVAFNKIGSRGMFQKNEMTLMSAYQSSLHLHFFILTNGRLSFFNLAIRVGMKYFFQKGGVGLKGGLFRKGGDSLLRH